MMGVGSDMVGLLGGERRGRKGGWFEREPDLQGGDLERLVLGVGRLNEGETTGILGGRRERGARSGWEGVARLPLFSK